MNTHAQPRGEQRGRGGRPRANQPSKEPPARSGTYPNSKPSCLLLCCKIYKRITSLNRLALETHMQTSHNTEERARAESCFRELCAPTRRERRLRPAFLPLTAGSPRAPAPWPCPPQSAEHQPLGSGTRDRAKPTWPVRVSRPRPFPAAVEAGPGRPGTAPMGVGAPFRLTELVVENKCKNIFSLLTLVLKKESEDSAQLDTVFWNPGPGRVAVNYTHARLCACTHTHARTLLRKITPLHRRSEPRCHPETPAGPRVSVHLSPRTHAHTRTYTHTRIGDQSYAAAQKLQLEPESTHTSFRVEPTAKTMF